MIRGSTFGLQRPVLTYRIMRGHPYTTQKQDKVVVESMVTVLVEKMYNATKTANRRHPKKTHHIRLRFLVRALTISCGVLLEQISCLRRRRREGRKKQPHTFCSYSSLRARRCPSRPRPSVRQPLHACSRSASPADALRPP